MVLFYYLSTNFLKHILLIEKKKYLFPQETHEIICNPQKRVTDDVRELFEDKKLQDIVKKYFRQEYQNKKFFDSLEPYP